MIHKIFYSLVFFPFINFDTLVCDRWKLVSIKEYSFAKIKAVFYDTYDTQEYEVLFIHKDLSLKQDNLLYSTKNWNILWENSELTHQIYTILWVTDIKDFNFFKDKEFYDQIPFGVVLTITSKCNLFCVYCFNDYDYPLKDRNLRNWLWESDYKKIIDILYESWTRDIILTGWEPFTCPFLFSILEYLKEKWIFIRINTNGTLLTDSVLEKLNKNFVVSLMVSMHEFNNKDYFQVNQKGAQLIQWLAWIKNFESKFQDKVEQLKKVPLYKNIWLDFLTILSPKVILSLELIYDWVLWNFSLDNWHFFRLYSTDTGPGISRPMINLAVHKIYKLNQKFSTSFKIVDSVPFCITKNWEIAKSVIDGELSVHHNVKTIITTDGNIQIMSAFDSNLGSIFKNDISEVWKWDFVQNMLKHWFLPDECKDCKYKEDCRWGSRMDANIYNGNYSAFDPLWDIQNKVKI